MSKAVGLLCVAFPCLVQALPTDIQLIGPTMSDWVHIGDSTVNSWPPSVGDSWSALFNLEVAPLGDSTLRFYHIEADPNTDLLYVNDVEVGWLLESDGTIDRDPTDTADWVEQSLVIPSGVLQFGQNMLRVEAGVSFPGSSFPLDDFLLKDMRLTVIPEPATITLLSLSSLALAIARRRK